MQVAKVLTAQRTTTLLHLHTTLSKIGTFNRKQMKQENKLSKHNFYKIPTCVLKPATISAITTWEAATG
jgi:hypothetical protein